MPEGWPFGDDPNVAVFTSRRIASGADWVYYVSHDEDDGAWEFYGPDGPASEDDTSIIGLGEMWRLTPRIAELADLPMGWCAWRESAHAPWQRMEIPE